MEKIKVAFFGSADFSIPTLAELFIDKEIEVCSVITLPPAKKNRGKKLTNNIVHDFALQRGFDEGSILTPTTLKNNAELIEKLKKQELDFIIVVAYGKIITKPIIELPKHEILNLHPSALPKYRGAAPIERAIENGETSTDICIMKVDVGLDTGDVAVRETFRIFQNETAKEIIPKIASIGARLMVQTIKNCKNGTVKFEKQTEEGMIYANKIEKSELFIDLNDMRLEALKTFNKIRAFNNCGCCYFLFNGTRIKIIEADFIAGNFSNYGFDKTTGEIVLNGGKISPKTLQKEGKKPINIKDFLNGLK